MKKLEIPCTYQGGKQRLSKQIVDIFYRENEINENTIFYDLCCGSGAISLELINRGFNPRNIVMVDSGCFGAFWEMVANNEFELKVFESELNKLPSIENIQLYLKNLSNQNVNNELMVYHYLMLQAGAFGSKQIWIEGGKWKNNSFRRYWLPTETSNRKSPVNPMMPMPQTLYKRVTNIVEQLSGRITAYQESVFDTLSRLNKKLTYGNKNIIIYCDPPYQNTTKYKESFDVYELKRKIWNNHPIYVSEGVQIGGVSHSHLLSKGRTKGNISGESKKKPVEEWLNIF